MVAACWNVFMIPVNIAFTIEDSVVEKINTSIDICFAVDIIIVFKTAILDDQGDEITDARAIARSYLKGRFALDFLSTFPFEEVIRSFGDVDTSKRLSILGALKWFRFLRINRIILYLNVKQQIKDSIRFVKVAFFLLVYMHFMACVWYFIVNQRKLWIPNRDVLFGWKSQGQFF